MRRRLLFWLLARVANAQAAVRHLPCRVQGVVWRGAAPKGGPVLFWRCARCGYLRRPFVLQERGR